MTGFELDEVGDSWLTPSWEHAKVSDAMHIGVLGCHPDTSLRTVARMMSTHQVHAVVVTAEQVDQKGDVAERPWGVITDLSLARIGGRTGEHTAGDVADPGVVTAEVGWPLAQAAELMVERKTAHLVVVDSRQRPIGMLSTLDLVRVIASGHG